MQTLNSIKKLVSDVEYGGWEFVVTEKGDGFLIQIQFISSDSDNPGVLELQKCRKWYVSPHSCDAEVIRTCFIAVKQAEEHELCERFRFKGKQIYNPHIDPVQLAAFVDGKPFQTRNKSTKTIKYLMP